MIKKDHIKAVILAGGKGTRMQSHQPKVLFTLAGQPIVWYILEKLKDLAIEPLIVVGHKAEQVKKILGLHYQYIFQKEQLGTAYALRQALKHLPKEIKTVIVFNGDDSAFYRLTTIEKLLEAHFNNQAKITLMTLTLDNPAGFGRILRGADGRVLGIKEERVASASEKKIAEINIGAYVFDVAFLRRQLPRVRRNPTGEYFITDLVALAAQSGDTIAACSLTDSNEWMGINTREQLALARKMMRRRLSGEDGLMISVAGIRGVIGESFSPDMVARLGAAFGTLFGKRIIIARDPRPSSEMIKLALSAGLLTSGSQVIDAGIVPTPTLQFLIPEFQATGGIMISASHNPVEWNALKLFGADSAYLSRAALNSVLKIGRNGIFKQMPWHHLRSFEEDSSRNQVHLKKILQLVDGAVIRRRRFRVAIDSCNGAGSILTLELLRRLGCRVRAIHSDPTIIFPHQPEPIAKNLRELTAVMRKGQYDIGFAQDADADRLALVDERGHYLGEEYTVALGIYHIFKHHRPNKEIAVVNLSSSRINDDVALLLGGQILRAPVGEANVVELMKKTGAAIGGEGNGGLIFPPLHHSRDSLMAIALMLELLTKERRPLSEIHRNLPVYIIVKEKFLFKESLKDSLPDIYEKIIRVYSGNKIDRSDGLRIDGPDFWFHLRPSGTEPVLRLIVEAPSREAANTIVLNLKRFLFGNNHVRI